MALTKRVEVLFEPEQYRAIEELARRSGETVGSLVRHAVEERYLQADLDKRREGLRRLRTVRNDFSWEEAKKIIETDVGRRL